MKINIVLVSVLLVVSMFVIPKAFGDIIPMDHYEILAGSERRKVNDLDNKVLILVKDIITEGKFSSNFKEQNRNKLSSLIKESKELKNSFIHRIEEIKKDEIDTRKRHDEYIKNRPKPKTDDSFANYLYYKRIPHLFDYDHDILLYEENLKLLERTEKKLNVLQEYIGDDSFSLVEIKLLIILYPIPFVMLLILLIGLVCLWVTGRGRRKAKK